MESKHFMETMILHGRMVLGCLLQSSNLMLLELIGTGGKKKKVLLPKEKKKEWGGGGSDIMRDFPSKRKKHCTGSHTEKYFLEWSNGPTDQQQTGNWGTLYFTAGHHLKSPNHIQFPF